MWVEAHISCFFLYIFLDLLISGWTVFGFLSLAVDETVAFLLGIIER